MIIGVPRETGLQERRTGLTPWAVGQLVRAGHTVVVESDAGRAARFDDREYQSNGATIVYSRDEAFKRADAVCGIHMLPAADLDALKPRSVLFGFHHLAVAPPGVVARLRQLCVTAIGYELIENGDGERPVLTPMSELAGDMAVYVAAHHLQNEEGGRGIMLGAVPGISPPTVLILGAGTVGRAAARRAWVVGAHVIVLDDDMAKLRAVSRACGPGLVTELATHDRLARYTAIADVVIGAVLVPGARAPHLVTEDMVRGMRAGSVIVDVSIDQGGCVETSRPTTLRDPVFIQHDVVHYCVPNMTANVARTASRALSDAILGPVRRLADMGVAAALRSHPGLAAGLYLYRGRVVNQALARTLGTTAARLDELLADEEQA
jgi:alanine dehydrogenase